MHSKQRAGIVGEACFLVSHLFVMHKPASHESIKVGNRAHRYWRVLIILYLTVSLCFEPVFTVLYWKIPANKFSGKKSVATGRLVDEQSCDDESEESPDAAELDSSNTSFSELDLSKLGDAPRDLSIQETEDTRAKFTFEIGKDESAQDDTDQDATLSMLFRSPCKKSTSVADKLSAEGVIHSQPIISNHQDETDAEKKAVHNNASAHTYFNTPEQAFVSGMEIDHLQENEQEPCESELECADMSIEVVYPSLPETSCLKESVPEAVETLEEATETSMDLDIHQDMEDEPDSSLTHTADEEQWSTIGTTVPQETTVTGQGPQEDTEILALPPPGTRMVDDISFGLTLAPSIPSSREPTPRRLRSPSPPPRLYTEADDVTATIALDDDTALLKDFLSRAAVSKANKAATIARRESLQNRRDSDVIRHALASPRKILEDKDPNSPSKHDNDATLDLSQTITLNMDVPNPSPIEAQPSAEDIEDPKESRRSRRSSRTRASRLPAPSSLQTGPPKIAVRRADGGEPIVLKKTDAQELSLLTRSNTRKNKQGAFAVGVRLLKLAAEARNAEDSTIDYVGSSVQVPGKKYVRWDSQLAYFQEGTDTIANMLADAESLATPDELSLPLLSTKAAKSNQSKDKTSTPKVKRVRGLGTTNGTPGKGLLAPVSLLPDAVQGEKEEAQKQAQLQSKQKSKIKKMPVASTPATGISHVPVETIPSPSDVGPIVTEPTNPATKERKSRLATPRKVKLPQLSSAVPVEGKENPQRVGIAAATPKKGIPVPSVVIPSAVGMETGLPRRRARRL